MGSVFAEKELCGLRLASNLFGAEKVYSTCTLL